MSFKNYVKTGAYSLAGIVAFTGLASAQVDELIVTATKRETSLIDTPVSVSVTTGDTLEKAAINDVLDLQSTVPSLKVNQQNTAAQNTFLIRGFGNGANNPGVEPAVAIVVDGVSRTRNQSGLNDLISVERVEVVRGPQSTLFGRSASAGVISITTAKPENEFGGKISVTGGDYDLNIIKGTVTGPLSDSTSFRLSASSHQRDGYTDNTVTGGKINDRDRYAVRGQLLTEVSDELTIRVIGDYDSAEEICCDIAILTNGLVNGGLLLGGLITELPSTNGWDYSAEQNVDPENEIEGKGLSVQADLDMDFAMLTSITSYRENSHSSNSDVDFGEVDVLNQTIDDEYETFSQELRLTSQNDGSFQWMVGAYYLDEDLKHDRSVTYLSAITDVANILLSAQGTNLTEIAGGVGVGALATVANLPSASQVAAGFANPLNPTAGLFLDGSGNPLGAAHTASPFYAATLAATSAGILDSWFNNGDGLQSELFEMNTETISIYAQFDFDITDRLSASLGVNYTDDEKTVVSNVQIIDEFATVPFAADPTTAALTSFQFFPPFTNYPNADVDGVFSSSDVTYSAKLVYAIDDNSNAYVNVATGFKPSSVNMSSNAVNYVGATDASAVPYSVGPEDVEMIEIGYKTRLENGYINVAIFDQSITDFQSNIFVGTGFNLVNVGEQVHRGLEIDGLLYLTENFFTTFAVSLIDAEYKDHEFGPCDRLRSGDPADDCPIGSGYVPLTGRTPAGVPETAITVSGNYAFEVTNTITGFFRAEYVFEDEIQAVDNVSKEIAAREVGTLNASLNFTDEASGWGVSLWGRNINEDEFLQTAFPIPGSDSFAGYPNAPRMWGVTIGKEF